ncbi:uncharacterized protein LOC132758310 [Ruditapes philippinarum]|uniref:uncharacterized protein LOC132758310 n=1 Tax=Ruditapes philippinarum TaxID=129788 RepID=UPI00295C2AB1|nr:uncharacterized protein LOC132758310 [Ruditapes philippinarum]
MKQIREKHPERMPDSDESGEDGENSQDDREEQLPSASPALSTASGEQDTSTSGNRKKKASREESTALLQRLQERIQKSSQLQEKLIDEMSVPKDPRVAERRQWAQWFGSAITDIDDSLWSDFQAESLQLVSNFKVRSKSLQQAPVQQFPLQPSLPSADQERADYHTAKRLQTINYSSNPGGYLPVWQQMYQPPPPMFPPQSYPGRSQSAPLSTTATITAGPTYDTVQSTSTGASSVGQADSLRELMTFSGITTVNESSENDIVDV